MENRKMKKSSTFSKKKALAKKEQTPENNEHFSGHYGYTKDEWLQRVEMERIGNPMWHDHGADTNYLLND